MFYKYTPDTLAMISMRILKYDDPLVTAMDNATYQSYVSSLDNYSNVQWRPKADPVNAWAMPYITGHKYKIHWGSGLDWLQMQVDLSSRWETTDKDIQFVHNFTDVRAQIDFITGGGKVPNATILSTPNSTVL